MPKVTFKPYTPLPEDTYLVRIVDCNIQENRINHQEFYSWTVEVVDDSSEFFGERFNIATPLQFGPNASAYKFFLAAGMQEQQEAVEFDTNDFIGAELYVKLKIVSKDGRESNKPEAFISLAEMQALVAKASRVPVKGGAVTRSAVQGAGVPKATPSTAMNSSIRGRGGVVGRSTNQVRHISPESKTETPSQNMNNDVDENMDFPE